MMGLGQGNRAAPPSWIQLSTVLVNVFKQLELRALVVDPITQESIHSMGKLFVDDTDLYMWKDGLLDTGELWLQTQLELTKWSTLLNATGGALKPEKCFWYMLDYTCEDGEWSYEEMTPRELFVTNPDGTKSQINQEEVTVSKKTLGIHISTAGGNEEHLKYIQQKASTWTDRMTNGHLPHHMACIAYRLQLWPGLRHGLGTMTNDIEEATSVNTKTDYRMLNILGVARTVTKGLRTLHTTFGGCGILSVATEQLICRINMLLQHYHTSTNLSRKHDASLRYLQLQLGTPHNPVTLDYDKWGYLAPLSWVKMLWRLLHHFNIHLHMECATISCPRERDQVVMELILGKVLDRKTIRSLSRCRGSLEIIFLSDMTTADGRYLEQFVFNPGSKVARSKYKFPRESPAKKDWTLGSTSGTIIQTPGTNFTPLWEHG